MDDKAVAWLRAQIEVRLATAKEARHDGTGHWWRREAAIYLNRPPVPVSHLYEGEPCRDEDGEIVAGDSIVVYDEGAPSNEEFAHIALNDPADTIARCEAELARLARHEGVHRCDWGEHRGGDFGACSDVLELASAYKHWEDYAEHFGSTDAPSPTATP